VNHAPILALAPNGAYKQKSDHSALPLSIVEIVQTALDAQRTGASLLHLHIRDGDNRHSLDPSTYLRTIAAIEDRIGDSLIIQITSETARLFSTSQQITTIKTVNPACVSIALREIIPEPDSVADAQALFEWCAEELCRIQFILYSEQDLLAYFDYQKRAIIPDTPHSVLFVLGRYSQNQQSSTQDLLPFLEHRDSLSVPWMICAFGASEPLCLIDAAKRGGHMRLGFENNLLKADGEFAVNNISQLLDLKKRAEIEDMKIATLEQARQLLQIRGN
jgi:3-keto-5-aminohexanoate cleavage enzyme